MSGIVIAAREGDRLWAERVAAPFRAALGDENVLIASSTAQRQGWSFVVRYKNETKSRECRALLLIMGSAWQDSMSLLDNPDDFLRTIAIEAMESNAFVVPFFAEGVTLSSGVQLPEMLKSLENLPSVELRAEGYMEELDAFTEQFVPYVKGEVRLAMAAPPDILCDMEDVDVSAPAPAAAPEPEPVMLGASAPRAVKPGGEFTARFVAYEKQMEQQVRDLLKKLSARVEPVLGVQECRWRQGTRVVVKLSGRGLVIDPSEQEFVWNGGRSLLEFDVAVPRETPEDTVVLKFDVAVEGFVVARLRLDLEITAHPVAGESTTENIEAAKTAFASYSSKDRLRVLDRVATVQISAGLEIFLDCLDLRHGEEWKPRLDAEIRRRDLFLLFWSKSASKSKWVRWELETALTEKGEHALQVHPLDPDVKPPAGLEKYHLSGVEMWVRKGYEASLAGKT